MTNLNTSVAPIAEEVPQGFWALGLSPLKKYATFQGRARRKEIFFFYLVMLLFSFGISLVGVILGIDENLLMGLIYLGFTLPGIAVAVRRMHDMNKSGWWILVPFYNLIIYFMAGQQGPNRFGPDPKTAPDL